MSKRAVETEERFINPYTFVSLGGHVERSMPADGDLTGKISCMLKVHSPLAIPDAEQRRATVCGKDNLHYDYPFSASARLRPFLAVRSAVCCARSTRHFQTAASRSITITCSPRGIRLRAFRASCAGIKVPAGISMRRK